MTSAINPNNIDGAYPVAGQDNNSQGFRDNFTNTKTNFQYASDEITDLQNKVVLKAALTGTVLNNNMQGSILSNAQLQDMSESRVNLGTVSGSVTVDYSVASFQTVVTNGNLSFAFANWPAAGQLGRVALQITVSSTTHTVTLPVAASVNALGIQGFDSTLNQFSFASTGIYTFVFSSYDGGATITVNQDNTLLQPFNSTGDEISNAGACSLATTSTKFTTTGAWTATLAAGVYGQIKEFIMTGDGGDMVITVANPGWKTSGTGTITFSAQGQGCILRFATKPGGTQGFWWCVGNNGCVFA
jgi:hypothetical protein